MYIRIEYSFTRIKYMRPDGNCGTTSFYRSQAGKIGDSCSDIMWWLFSKALHQTDSECYLDLKIGRNVCCSISNAHQVLDILKYFLCRMGY